MCRDARVRQAKALDDEGPRNAFDAMPSGGTQTLPLLVPPFYQEFNFTGAYTTAIVLALLALSALFAMNRFKPKEGV